MEEFIALLSDGNLKLQFTSRNSSKFWQMCKTNTLPLQEKNTGVQKQNTGADWMLKRTCTFSYQLLHQTLNVFPFLCKLILLIKIGK